MTPEEFLARVELKGHHPFGGEELTNYFRSIDPRKGKDMNDSLNTGFKPIPDAATPKLSDEQLAQLLAKNPDLAFVTTDEAEDGSTHDGSEKPTVH